MNARRGRSEGAEVMAGVSLQVTGAVSVGDASLALSEALLASPWSGTSVVDPASVVSSTTGVSWAAGVSVAVVASAESDAVPASTATTSCPAALGEVGEQAASISPRATAMAGHPKVARFEPTSFATVASSMVGTRCED